MANNPKVFISYSHDSNDYKDWVIAFSNRLILEGIDVILDQYDLILGDKNPKFMEENIANSDFVVMLVSKKYKEKANNREGGVGYETDLVTGEISVHGNRRKFIPILVKIDYSEVPEYLTGTNALRITNLFNYDKEYEELYKVLTNQTLKKPKLGKIRKITTTGEEQVFDIEKLCTYKKVTNWISFDCIFELSSLAQYTLPEIYKELLKNRLEFNNPRLWGEKKIYQPYVFSDENKKTHNSSIIYESGDYYSGFSNVSVYEKIQFDNNYIRYSYIEMSDYKESFFKGKNVICSLLYILKMLEKTITALNEEESVNVSFNFESNNNSLFYTKEKTFVKETFLSNYYLGNDKKGSFDFHDFSINSKEKFINRILEKFISNNPDDNNPFLSLQDNSLEILDNELNNGNYYFDY